MPLLTTAQRYMLINRLQVQAKPKGFANKFAKMFESQKTRDAAVGKRVRELDDAYNRAEAACQALRASHAGTHAALCDKFDALLGAIKTRVQGNLANINLAGLEAEMAALGNLQNAAGLADANPGHAATLQTDCDALFASLRLELDNLAGHPQTHHIDAILETHEKSYAKAQDFYGKGDFQEARRILGQVNAAHPQAKIYADNYATVVPSLTEASIRVAAYRKCMGDKQTYSLFAQRLKLAKIDASQPGGNYTQATTEFDNISIDINAEMLNELCTLNTGKLDKLIEEVNLININLTYKQIHITELTNIKNDITLNLNNKKTKESVLNCMHFFSRYSAALHACERREEYEKYRQPIADAVQAIQGSAHLTPVQTQILTDLNAIDIQADNATITLEDARELLSALNERCRDAEKLSVKITDYRALRIPVDQRLAALRLQPEANGLLAQGIAAIDARMPAVPANTATAAASPLPAVWAGWVKQLDWISGEIDKFQRLAAPFQAIDGAAISPQNLGVSDEIWRSSQLLRAQITAALDLRRQIETRQRGNQPVPMENDLTAAGQLVNGATNTADRARGAADEAAQITVASNSLNGCGNTLKTIWTTLVEYDAIVARHDRLDEQLTALEQSPEYLGRIAMAVANTRQGLHDALSFPGTQTAQSAQQLLDTAQAEITRATELRGSRQQFNALYADIRAKVAKLQNAPAQHTTDLQAAVTLADQLDFVAANGQLEALRTKIMAGSLGELAGANPDRKKFMSAVKALLKQPDGDKALDAIIEAAPPSFSAKLLKEVAAERFGIQFTVDKLKGRTRSERSAEDRQQKISGLLLYNMLAKVPGDVLDNLSLTKVTAAGPEAPGMEEAYYSPLDKEAVMLARPGAVRVLFPAAELDQTRIEAGCEPDNTDDVDFFDFATLHEVGHAVDDQLAFMDRHLNDNAFGGWMTHRDIGPIAIAVAGKYGYNTTPAQLDYVRELLLGGEPTPPTPPAGSEAAWEGAVQRINAWRTITSHGQALWDRDDFSRTSAIGGRVYHEAYENMWVSYNADARNRGITGYQFRAPGEWFAELYAAYHSGKLKLAHPASAWLSTL
ncbi:hypothetical protein [Radicibacter daui]|uniref:hypothetical protein n=1 Tax=Radicibacter daui TaxID=3064829 RepID=UPI004046D5DD